MLNAHPIGTIITGNLFSAWNISVMLALCFLLLASFSAQCDTFFPWAVRGFWLTLCLACLERWMHGQSLHTLSLCSPGATFVAEGLWSPCSEGEPWKGNTCTIWWKSNGRVWNCLLLDSGWLPHYVLTNQDQSPDAQVKNKSCSLPWRCCDLNGQDGHKKGGGKT